jgi:hypothetical protein
MALLALTELDEETAHFERRSGSLSSGICIARRTPGPQKTTHRDVHKSTTHVKQGIQRGDCWQMQKSRSRRWSRRNSIVRILRVMLKGLAKLLRFRQLALGNSSNLHALGSKNPLQRGQQKRLELMRGNAGEAIRMLNSARLKCFADGDFDGKKFEGE